MGKSLSLLFVPPTKRRQNGDEHKAAFFHFSPYFIFFFHMVFCCFYGLFLNIIQPYPWLFIPSTIHSIPKIQMLFGPVCGKTQHCFIASLLFFFKSIYCHIFFYTAFYVLSISICNPPFQSFFSKINARFKLTSSIASSV